MKNVAAASVNKGCCSHAALKTALGEAYRDSGWRGDAPIKPSVTAAALVVHPAGPRMGRHSPVGPGSRGAGRKKGVSEPRLCTFSYVEKG